MKLTDAQLTMARTASNRTESIHYDLQTQIDEAEGGGVLTLEAGTHQLPPGGVTIGSDIEIVGETGDPHDVILQGSRGHDMSETNYINMKSYPEQDITIRNVTVDSTWTEDDFSFGDGVGDSRHMVVISGDNILIENCRFLNGTRDCLDISQSVGVTVRDSVLDGAFTDDVIEINDTSEPTGISSTDFRSDDILIEHCEIRNAGIGTGRHWANGIEVEAALPGKLTIKGCLIEDNAGLDLDIQDDQGTFEPQEIDCLNTEFKTIPTPGSTGTNPNFEGDVGELLFFDEDCIFAEDDIDNVLTGYRKNVHAPAFSIES